MNRIHLLLIMCCLMNPFGSVVLYADDMELEIEDGISVLLHDDHTWDYISAYTPELKQNVTLSLEGNQIIQVNRNQTWYFVDGLPHTDEIVSESTYLGSVYAMGTAQGSELIHTKKAAIEKATLQLARQIKKTTKDKSLSVKKLSKCIDQEGKEIKIQENFTKKIWKIQISLSVDSDQMQLIIDCSKDDIE